MYKILNVNKVETKISGQFPYKDKIVKYVAAPLLEKFTVETPEGEEVGILLAKTKKDRTLGINVNTYEYTSTVEDFLELFNIEDVNFEEDLKPKGNQSKNKKNKTTGETYKWLVYDNRIEDEVLDSFSLENFIYEPRTKESVLKNKNLDWVKDKDYKVLITKKEIDDYIDFLETLPKDTLLSFDTETTGLRADRFKTDDIVGLSLSHKVHFGVYIPFSQKYGKNCECSPEYVLDRLKPLLDEFSEDKLPIIGHNLGFDWKVVKMYGISLNIVEDTYVKMALIHHAENTHIRSLKGSVEHIFGIDVLELDEMFEKKTKRHLDKAQDLAKRGLPLDPITKRKLLYAKEFKDMTDFRYAPEWFYTLYGPADGDFPLWLYENLTAPEGKWTSYENDQGQNELGIVYRLEVGVIPSFSEQEFYGVRFNSDEIIAIGNDAKEELKEIEETIYEKVGYKFNINSNQQLGKVLYEDLGNSSIRIPKFQTKDGSWKTDKKTLKMLKNYTGSMEIFQEVLELLDRQSYLSHQISSFYDALPELAVNGYLFPQYNQLGADTGRVTCKNPNVQQMHPSVRPSILPDNDEYYFATCDFSQIERRVMGGVSGEDGITQVFIEDTEADSHIQTYSLMTGTPYDDVTHDQRSFGKTMNFATVYGMSPQNLATILYGNDQKESVALAEGMIKQYFEAVPTLDKYLEEKRDLSEVKGYAETYFGRRRYIQQFHDYTTGKLVKPITNLPQWLREKGRRAAGNMQIQGTAADILKLAMLRLRKSFLNYGFDDTKASIRMNVHDEVTYCLHKSIHPRLACKIIKEAMELDMSEYGFPPFYIGMNIGENWYHGKRDDLEAPVLKMQENIEWSNERIELLEKEDPDTPLAQKEGFSEQFPYVQDPISLWLDDIKEYSLRQVYEERQKGVIKSNGEHLPINHLFEAFGNSRLVKYTNYFNDIENSFDTNFLILEAIHYPSYEEYFNDYDLITQGQGKYSRKAFEWLNEHKPEEITKDNLKYVEFLGKGYQEVLENLKEGYTIVGVETSQLGYSAVKMSNDQIIDLRNDKKDWMKEREYPQIKPQGQEVEDKPLTVSERLRQDTKVIGQQILFKPPKDDVGLMKFLEEAAIPTNLIDLFEKDHKKRYKLTLVLATDVRFEISGYFIAEYNIQLMYKALTYYYTEENLGDLYNELDRIQNKS